MTIFTRKRVWEALNSAFVLWILSSLILSGVTYSYTQWQSSALEARTANAQIRKLDIEIGHRLQFLSFGLELARLKKDPEEFGKAIEIAANPETSEYPPYVFSEFERRSLSSLMWELEFLVEPGAKSEISEAAKAASSLMKVFYAPKLFKAAVEKTPLRRLLKIVVVSTLMEPDGNGKTFIEATLDPVNLERWGKPLDLHLFDELIKKIPNK